MFLLELPVMQRIGVLLLKSLPNFDVARYTAHVRSSPMRPTHAHGINGNKPPSIVRVYGMMPGEHELRLHGKDRRGQERCHARTAVRDTGITIQTGVPMTFMNP